MTEAKKKLGFVPKTSKTSEKKEVIKEPKGRLISWSPWPPANFKTRYQAFPLSYDCFDFNKFTLAYLG